jgi:aspartyl-tRNA synthetase
MGNHNQESTNIAGLMKTHHCAELRASDIGKEITLCGWNNKYRDLGGLHFIDIRDKHGLTQLAFDEFKGDFSVLKGLSLESVIMAKGIVRARPDSAKNKSMDTGEVEVSVLEISELSHAEEVPFLPHGKVQATEDLRLKYRYLDLRGDKLQNILSIRSNAMQITRQALY